MIAVADRELGQVVGFDAATRDPVPEARFVLGAAEGLVGPVGVAVGHSGEVYVADRAAHRLVCFPDPDDPAQHVELGSQGAGTFEFDRPCAVAVGPSGEIVVTDEGNGRLVSVDDISGTGWTTIGTKGKAPPDDVGTEVLWRPLATCFQRGAPVVADPGNARVVALGSGWYDVARGELPVPVGVASDERNGVIYVSDLKLRTLFVIRVTQTGQDDGPRPLTSGDPATALLLAPTGLAYGHRDDMLLVADPALRRVLVLHIPSREIGLAFAGYTHYPGLEQVVQPFVHPTGVAASPE